MAVQHNIMLEAGTNEFEVLVFQVGTRRCGVNVAKVREVIDPQPLTRLPQAPKTVLGMFQLRQNALPLIDLASCLGATSSTQPDKGQIIVLEYNDSRVAFRVDNVEYIHRIKVADVEALPEMEGLRSAPVTFVAHIGGDLVLMIDFEKILFEIGGINPFAEQITPEQSRDRASRSIVLAEDSATIRQMITNQLIGAGYKDVTQFADGQSAWDALEASVANGSRCSYDLVITDIEMPKMDGLHLTRRIKDHPVLGKLPVILFSSLVSADNQKKGSQVGADGQITKPQLFKVVSVIDELLGGGKEDVEAGEPVAVS